MLNSPFLLEQTRALVADSDRTGMEPRERVQQLYRRLFGRAADPSEVQAALAFVAAQEAKGPAERSGVSGSSAPTNELLGAWEKYAQVLLATNEFAFVD